MMKNILVILSIFLISLAFVFAANGTPVNSGMAYQGNSEDVNESDDDLEDEDFEDDLNESGNGKPMNFSKGLSRVASGNFELVNGLAVRVQEKSQNRYQIKSGNVSADCDCEMTQEQEQNKTKLYAHLSNGKNAEIKVMPNTASERALERLRLKVCDENCSIELKEVNDGNEAKLAYEVKTERQSRVFGLFKKQMNVEAQVDAETGQVMKVKKPWWAFLASEPDETSEDSE